MGIDFKAYVEVDNETEEDTFFFLADLGNSWARHQMFAPYRPDRKAQGRIIINQVILDHMKSEIAKMRDTETGLYDKMMDAQKGATHVGDYECEWKDYISYHDWCLTVTRTYQSWALALDNPHCTPVVTFS